MTYNEWKDLDYVGEFLDNLDENEHPIALLARVIYFAFTEGQKYGGSELSKTNEYDLLQDIRETAREYRDALAQSDSAENANVEDDN